MFQDWSDLIEYVINTFVKKPKMFLFPELDTGDSGDESKMFGKSMETMSSDSDVAIKSNSVKDSMNETVFERYLKFLLVIGFDVSL